MHRRVLREVGGDRFEVAPLVEPGSEAENAVNSAGDALSAPPCALAVIGGATCNRACTGCVREVCTGRVGEVPMRGVYRACTRSVQDVYERCAQGLYRVCTGFLRDEYEVCV